MKNYFKIVKQEIFYWMGIPDVDILTDMEQKLTKLEHDIDRYKTKIRSNRLRKSYDEIIHSIKSDTEVDNNEDDQELDLEESGYGEAVMQDQEDSTAALAKMIIMDRDPSTKTFFETRLQGQYQVAICQDVEQLIASMENEEPAYIFFDRSLLASDEMRQAFESLQKAHPHLKWVSLSQYLTELVTLGSNPNLRLSGTLQKPIEEVHLKRLLSA